MNSESQRQEISNSLKALTEVCKSCSAEYRIFGSVLIVAHIDNVFRRIGDVGVLLDSQNKDCVFEK